MRRIGIIGGGRFGTTLALGLAREGVDVLFMDKDPAVVLHMSAHVRKAVQGDSSDAEALAQAGFSSCDVVVVAMGSNLEASVLATMALKDLKVPRLIAKASSDIHGKVLQRVGADQIVFPERDRAAGLARALVARSVLDFIEVGPGSGIFEVQAPAHWVGKPLGETRIRNVYGLTVLAIRRAAGPDGTREELVAPSGDDVIEERDILVLFGAEEKLRRFEREIH
jgi:trk system potassium uptake protein TrkA